MDEYINRKSLMKRLCERCNEEMSESPCEPSECFIREIIKSIPAADVAPVRHGRWVIDEKRYVIYCSECGEVSGYSLNLRDVREENHYCPNCGAKMDGDE